MDGKLITNIVIGIVLGALALIRRSSPAPEAPAEPEGEPCAAHGMRNCSLCRDQR